MSAPHPLSAVEVESLRQMRTRLNKPAASDAAAATLCRTALQVLARVGVIARPVASAPPASPAAFRAQAGDAELTELSALAGVLSAAIAAARPGELRGWLKDGAPQALISRRLQLAGREGVEPRG